jgi:hypothetical protein
MQNPPPNAPLYDLNANDIYGPMSADTGVHLLYDVNEKMGVCSTI